MLLEGGVSSETFDAIFFLVFKEVGDCELVVLGGAIQDKLLSSSWRRRRR